jgi:hypothetical protein
MATPMDAYVRLQLALCAGWARLITRSSQACADAIEHHAQILYPPRRTRLCNAIPDGADWFDRYGRRHTDIDVERV